jgi:hypothetical protein
VYCVYVLLTDKMGFEINLPFQYVLGAYLVVCLIVFFVKTLSPVKSAQPQTKAS